MLNSRNCLKVEITGNLAKEKLPQAVMPYAFNITTDPSPNKPIIVITKRPKLLSKS